MDGFALARRMMVDGQIRTSDVTDRRVIAAFEDVPRERFVPPEQVPLAYLDRDLPVLDAGPGGAARTFLKPMVLARLVQAAEIGASARVLDVGCATGYSSAVLSRLAGEVIALEEDAELAARAEAILPALGIANVGLRHGPLSEGSRDDAPFDAIVINGAVEFIPEEFRRQLREGGRLVCVLRDGGVGRGMLYRSAGDLSGRPLFDAGASLLTAFARPPAFVF